MGDVQIICTIRLIKRVFVLSFSHFDFGDKKIPQFLQFLQLTVSEKRVKKIYYYILYNIYII